MTYFLCRAGKQTLTFRLPQIQGDESDAVYRTWRAMPPPKQSIKCLSTGNRWRLGEQAPSRRSGLIALANQTIGHPVGYINPVLSGGGRGSDLTRITSTNQNHDHLEKIQVVVAFWGLLLEGIG